MLTPLFRYLFCLSFLMLAHCLVAQKSSHDLFLKQIDAFDLYFYEPVEGQAKYKSAGHNSIFSYDAHLRLKEERKEVYFFLNDIAETAVINQAPHVEFMRQVSDMASNDENNSIWIRMYEGSDLQKYNAEWVCEARFVPKNQFTRYKKGRLLGIFRKDKGLATVLYLSDKDGPYMDFLSFKSDDY